jgi:hypothetical protein
MRKLLFLTALALLAGVPADRGMAGTKSPKLAKCNGKHRRPANLFGTILPSVDPQTGIVTSKPRGGVDVFETNPTDGKDAPIPAKPATIVPPISALDPSKIYGSC